MISDNSTVANISAATYSNILDQQDASDELREQVIEESGLRKAKWEETTDLPRDWETVEKLKWDVCQDRTLSIYRNWNRDFYGHVNEQDAMVTILHQWREGADIPATDYLASTTEWLATPKPYTHAAFIKIRDGLIIPQSPPRRVRNKPEGGGGDHGEGERREPGKRIPVSVQQEVYRKIVHEHPEWSSREINEESHRVFERELGEGYQMPKRRTTERVMQEDPQIVETRERGYFVWNRAGCGVPAERAVIDGDGQTRLCVMCGADISHKQAAAVTCTPACRKARQRRARKPQMLNFDSPTGYVDQNAVDDDLSHV